MMDMDHRLVEIEARYEELNRRLQQPDVTADAKAMRELGKEHHRLQQIVEQHRLLVRSEKELGDAFELLQSESDAELLGLARSEVQQLEERVERLRSELLVLLLPRDENDEKNVLLEVRSGTGGDEAALFCGELFRAYARLAERHRWRVEVMSSSPGAQGGYKEVVALIEGEGAFAMLKYESGVHRVQRVPQTETQGRVHTSAVTVAVLPEAEDVDVELVDSELRIDVYRSSGPGGQSVNTTDSAVRITHLPTGLVVSCQDEKSQHKNKAKGLKILRSRLLDVRQREADEKQAEARRSQVKTGDRSEKVRTYNFPQDRLTDHRINMTVHNLPRIMQGELDDIITSLRSHFQAAALSQGA